jgi:CHAT domain-containing protein
LSDLARPSESCLLLHDYQRAPPTVLDVSRLHLKQAGLAYLSARSTGEVSAALPDEVIHIASSFQLAGYADVIATMWPVADSVAVPLTEAVYSRITDRHEPAAEALHDAVLQLRDEHPADPWLWAPFIHAGR